MEAEEAREIRDEEREEKRRKEYQEFLLKLVQVLQKERGIVFKPATVSGRFSVRYQSIFWRHLVKPKRLHIKIKQHFLITVVTEDSTLCSASSKML